MNPFDLGVYTFLKWESNQSTGIYTGTALTIAYRFGDHKLVKLIQKSLQRLREAGFISYQTGNGRRGGYPVLVHEEARITRGQFKDLFLERCSNR